MSVKGKIFGRRKIEKKTKVKMPKSQLGWLFRGLELAVLILTAFFAYKFGKSQVEIGEMQNVINQEQLRLNEDLAIENDRQFSKLYEIQKEQVEITKKLESVQAQLLELNYEISVSIYFNESQESIDIINNGKTNVFFHGWQEGLNAFTKMSESTIPPNTVQSIYSQKLFKRIREDIKPGEKVEIPFSVFLESSHRVKYLIEATLVFWKNDLGMFVVIDDKPAVKNDWTTRVSN